VATIANLAFLPALLISLRPKRTAIEKK